MIPKRELATYDHPETQTCTEGGVDHDFQRYTRDEAGGAWQRTYLRCIWCHGVTCGYADDLDPCMRIYHHREPHRSRFGYEWPIGGTRPDGSPHKAAQS